MNFNAEKWRTLHSPLSPKGDSLIAPSLLGLWCRCTGSALEKHENGASQQNQALLHCIIKSVQVREQIEVLGRMNLGKENLYGVRSEMASQASCQAGET